MTRERRSTDLSLKQRTCSSARPRTPVMPTSPLPPSDLDAEKLFFSATWNAALGFGPQGSVSRPSALHQRRPAERVAPNPLRAVPGQGGGGRGTVPPSQALGLAIDVARTQVRRSCRPEKACVVPALVSLPRRSSFLPSDSVCLSHGE